MAKRKLATTDSPEPSVSVLKADTCPTSSGKSTLSYEIGTDEEGSIYLKVAGNDGGGFFSNEWVSFQDIQAAITAWPKDQGITSMTFRKIFRGKSANTPGFLVAVLNAVDLLEPEGDKKRVHKACKPGAFLAHLQELQGKPARKARPKAKATPRAKANTPRKAPAKTAKTPRKSPARSKKTS